jgi:hypothetical protein
LMVVSIMMKYLLFLQYFLLQNEIMNLTVVQHKFCLSFNFPTLMHISYSYLLLLDPKKLPCCRIVSLCYLQLP